MDFLFIILGVIVLITVVVLGVLFYMLSKEGQKDEKAVPMTDINQLKKEFSSGLLDPQRPTLGALGPKTPLEPVVTLGAVSSPQQNLLEPETPQPAPAEPAVPAEPEDDYKAKAKDLEEELQSLSHRAETQSEEAKLMIETLSKENHALKVQKDTLLEAQQKLDEVNQETSGLKIANAGLAAQLDTASGKLKMLEEELTAVKLSMGDEISKARAAVETLSQEKDQLQLAAAVPHLDEQAVHELEAVKLELAQLRQKYEELQKDHQQAGELNTELAEKNNQLQYEMVKARAQSSGLERVSFNYKTQVEDFLKKVSAAQATQDQLSQVKSRLEGLVERVKLQNEELVKKDQLSQFELDKNRSRLTNLERENENLKAHLQLGQQKDHQA